MGRMAGNEALSDFSFVFSLSAVLDFLLVMPLGPDAKLSFAQLILGEARQERRRHQKITRDFSRDP